MVRRARLLCVRSLHRGSPGDTCRIRQTEVIYALSASCCQAHDVIKTKSNPTLIHIETGLTKRLPFYLYMFCQHIPDMF